MPPSKLIYGATSYILMEKLAPKVVKEIENKYKEALGIVGIEVKNEMSFGAVIVVYLPNKEAATAAEQKLPRALYGVPIRVRVIPISNKLDHYRRQRHTDSAAVKTLRGSRE